MSGRESASADTELSRQAVRSRAHASRVDEATEEHATHQMADQPWVRPSNLDAPPARKGYVQRWIRATFRGADDPEIGIANPVRDGSRGHWTPFPRSGSPWQATRSRRAGPLSSMI